MQPSPRRRNSAEGISAAPLVGVPADVVEYLTAAMDELQSAGVEAADLYLRARREAADATEASKAAPSDPEVIEALSRANARVAAAASMELARFPEEVAVTALISVANLCVSIGRARQVSGDLDSALEYYMAGLASIEAFKSYTRVSDVDAPLFNIAARAASIVGDLAARRKIGLEEMLNVLQRNIVTRYEPMMTNGDLSGPRGFAAVAFFREALLTKDEAYIRRVRDEIIARRRVLRPESPAARIRFDSDLDALLRTAEVSLGEVKPTEFKW